MARYESDCTTLTGWSEVWNTNGVYTVTAKAAARSGSVFRYSAASNYDSFLRFTSADAQNVDAVLGVYHAGTNFQSARIVCRASGTANTPATYNGYIGGIRYDGSGNRFAIIEKMVGGTRTSLSTVSVGTRISSGAQRVWIRFNVTGTTSPVALKLRIWLYGAAEPTTWDIDTTDSSTPFTASGYTGLYAGATEAGNHDYDYLGVDTTGTTLLIVPEVPLASAMTLSTYEGQINFIYPGTEAITLYATSPIPVIRLQPDFISTTLAANAPIGSIAYLPPAIFLSSATYDSTWFQTVSLVGTAAQSVNITSFGNATMFLDYLFGESRAIIPVSDASLDVDNYSSNRDVYAPLPSVSGSGNYEINLVGVV